MDSSSLPPSPAANPSHAFWSHHSFPCSSVSCWLVEASLPHLYDNQKFRNIPSVIDYFFYNKNWTSTDADTIPLSLQRFIQNVVGLAWWCSTRSFTLCLALLRRIFTRNLLLEPDCAPTVQNPERLHSRVPELMTTQSMTPSLPLLWSEFL